MSPLVDIVRGYVGTPYVHRGRLPGVALDCVGVAICALRTLGVPVGDFLYGVEPRVADLEAGLLQYARLVGLDERRPGDLVAATVTPGEMGHLIVPVGFTSGGRELFVQAAARRAASGVCETPLSPGLTLRSAWRVDLPPGVEA